MQGTGCQIPQASHLPQVITAKIHINFDITRQDDQKAAEAALSIAGFWYMLENRNNRRVAAIRKYDIAILNYLLVNATNRTFSAYDAKHTQ